MCSVAQLLAIGLSACLVFGIDAESELQTKQFVVALDHFSPQDSRTWNFTYVQNVEFYSAGGPLFVYVSEGDQYTTEYLQSGLMHDLAADIGGALVTANLRYFRNNLPTPNATFESLQFLTAKHIISDLAALVERTKYELGANRVILWGSGFGGSLATWTRLKFPHLVDGAWSSSGIYEAAVETTAKFEYLSQRLTEIGGAQCAQRIATAFRTMEHLHSRVHLLKEHLNLCYVSLIDAYGDLPGFFAGITQVIIDEVNRHHLSAVNGLCATLNHLNETDEFPEFATFASWIRTTHSFPCLDLSTISRTFDNRHDQWDNVHYWSWSQYAIVVAPFESRPQLYLACTQLANFATNYNLDDSRNLFRSRVSVDFYFSQCSHIFENFNFHRIPDAVRAHRTQFGRRNVAASNVIYTNGDLDALFPLGIHQSTAENSIVINITNYGKSADLRSVQSGDSAELQRAKNIIRQTIRQWVDVSVV